MLMSIKNKLKSKGDTLCHSIPIQIDTAQQMKFFIKDFFSKCDQIRKFTEEIYNGKFLFLCSVNSSLFAGVFNEGWYVLM